MPGVLTVPPVMREIKALAMKSASVRDLKTHTSETVATGCERNRGHRISRTAGGLSGWISTGNCGCEGASCQGKHRQECLCHSLSPLFPEPVHRPSCQPRDVGDEQHRSHQNKQERHRRPNDRVHFLLEAIRRQEQDNGDRWMKIAQL